MTRPGAAIHVAGRPSASVRRSSIPAQRALGFGCPGAGHAVEVRLQGRITGLTGQPRALRRQPDAFQG